MNHTISQSTVTLNLVFPRSGQELKILVPSEVAARVARCACENPAATRPQTESKDGSNQN